MMSVAGERNRHSVYVMALLGFLMMFGLDRTFAHAEPQGTESSSVTEWEAAWTRVLQRYVDEAGRIDFPGVAANRTDLDRVMAFIAGVDPSARSGLFPSLQSKLAYYINAYNAMAMDGVIDAGVPVRFGLIGRIRFFYLRTFTVGGRSISLYDLENHVIRPLGDPRVHFALNCMVVSCPRLQRTAFTARNLDRELDDVARAFVAEDRNVHVDAGQRVVHLSAIFDFYTDDFLARAPSLIAFINRYRTQPIPKDYTVRFLDYDWTINDRSRLAAARKADDPR